MSRTTRTGLPAGILIALLVPACAHADVTGGQIIGYLNAQRAAQGIPAAITENGAWSEGCRKHNHYGAQNASLSHDEDPKNPAYTPDGAQAGASAVIYFRSGTSADYWTPTVNPFEYAPIHLHQLLAPRIDVMGAYESEGYGCATTLASRNRPAPPADVVYTYPTDGATGWRAAETDREGPYTPGSLAGIAQGTTTGPTLYVLFDGPTVALNDSAQSTGASLTGPDGPVDVVTFDNMTKELQGYLPVGMQVLARSPLAPATTYTASVSAVVHSSNGAADRPFARTWRFTTAGPIAAPAAADGRLLVLRSTRAHLVGRQLRLSVRCRARCVLTVRGSLKLSARAAPIALKGPSLGAGSGTRTVRLQLTRRLAARVRAAGTRARVTVRVTPRSGATLKATLPIR